MAEVHRLPESRREFIADGSRSALRATWHHDSGFVVISLWRGNTCVATSHLTPREAGRLAVFITGGLAELADNPATEPTSIAPVGLDFRSGVRQVVSSGRRTLARSLEWMAKRIG